VNLRQEGTPHEYQYHGQHAASAHGRLGAPRHPRLQFRDCARLPNASPILRTPEGAPIPPNTLEELKRDTTRLRLVRDQIKEIDEARLMRLQAVPQTGSNAMVLLLARILGIGVETADMLVHEVLSRGWRDRRAVARYVSPDSPRTIGVCNEFGRACPRVTGLLITIRGGGVPLMSMALMPRSRLDPPSRSFAVDALG
jgi:hypothetical protein